jgi:hypothetical protein
MEPGEKTLKRLVRFALMVVAFVVSIVLGEFSFHGFGWMGPFIFIIGALMGALGVHLFKSLRD